MEDDAKAKKLRSILEGYTPEQLTAPDERFGTVQQRIAETYAEDPPKAAAELDEEAEEQQQGLNEQANRLTETGELTFVTRRKKKKKQPPQPHVAA